MGKEKDNGEKVVGTNRKGSTAKGHDIRRFGLTRISGRPLGVQPGDGLGSFVEVAEGKA